MRAWRLDVAAQSLTYEDVAVPEVHSGSIRVRVEATSLVKYQRDYVEGKLAGYHPPTGAFTPGTNAIGTIDEVGRDVYDLRPGQRVLLTGHYSVAENVPAPAEALLGMTAAPQSSAVLNTWRDGTFAEQVCVPASTATPIPPALEHLSSRTLVAVCRALVPYGGLLRGRLQVGETVAVNGATGSFGSAGVAVALAMGAARVVAAGRNVAMLERFAALGEGVSTVRLGGDVEEDADALRDAAGGQLDCALDLVGGARTPDSTLATLSALGRGGRLVLMGSSAAPLPIDYTQLMMTGRELLGNFMYPRWAPTRLLSIVAAGRLDLRNVPVHAFPLGELRAAMDTAAQPGAPLIVVEP